MAAREGDAALWLHNKLGSTDDLWSGSSICSNLSREKLLSIQECFYNLQPYVKVKLMLSFLHLPKRNVEEWRSELEDILHQATEDTDQWVAVVGEILRTYPQTGTLNTDVDTQHRFFHEVLSDLKKLVKRSGDVGMMPLECLYLNRLALQSTVSSLPQPMKHFALKRKPKSAALRAELMQKSVEAANNLRKNPLSGGMSIPIKSRSFAKKMDDTTPMKGIPSKTPLSGGFLRANSLSRGAFGGTPAMGQRTPTGRKEGGIKLLDITEMPLGAKEARKRKRQQEQEAAEKEKKEKEARANQTPDYAAGLVTPTASSDPFQAIVTPAGPSYAPNTTARLVTVSAVGAGTLQANTVTIARDGTQTMTLTPTVVTVTKQTTNTGVPQVVIPAGQTIVTVTPQQVPKQQQLVVQQQGQPEQQQGQQPQKKGSLSLTREQMVEAQEMFKTSNKVTRPEKALILGFMAGSRENPCKDQGDIVNIRLSEHQESIQQPDGTFRPMVVDTYFQMNYQTGEWKRIKKLREISEDDTEVE